ncbi:bifunctional cobalt-precorrin-7 (C(5))-methyltransferase/cobalt-precorrin-6B (C(15))-methyltransferase [Streptomyces pluripotens]|uniref:Bifunctional cobalt-precorrin-7 (C(5))-methyltransferase/cobalt-precorrin-6B (C(15))-methyltransferase n=1 Tax=Streptomyces pluripotens TaxID=1355015 RepID=A0A221NV78_9ACTN|nr:MULTISPECIES: bifunctional cobalt-precorrin-7 (C(5))-methyltransferase/cobalt-precorrin-6B (C(15))-methyltransferase [Streptomyces]ARP69614.1 bifunctional cobalt-precorrin-7 (C(5))-methyltransferase/cobalt-precorrin-6B (C(15))-methyltransferase [Streptomyces pluripotens]ASN23871.1 bifunctional cobalt-precorrin-7 (C(5))-methyltransferase/cobalt-precorrin-6B (C(15))-methyltransferase [Streptomyces pluripotens]KIE24540.1 precorrin-6Y C5,15-methyltransferase [Streptomyces sp. MUSC 125]MCH0558630
MITVVGTGTGAPLPDDVLAGASLVVGGRRHLDAVRLPDRAEQVVLGPLAPALDTIAEYTDQELPVVVLASGDPGFFGIVRALSERFGAGLLDVRPGVSSVAMAFARIGVPWDDAVVVSAHGRKLRTAVNACRALPKVAVLTGPGAGPGELGAALGGGRVLVVASALGDPRHERVERVTPAEAAARDWGAAVSVVLCLDEARVLGALRTVAGAPARPTRWALAESDFTHRDSMITKFEVRALALARLGPRLGDLVWDVGAGSGSVAVECVRLGAAVVAVEKTSDGVERIHANARAHGVDVHVVHGSAPQALSGLADDPDAVFVGGGGRELPAVVTACARRARRTVVVAMAALDRVPAAREALTAAGFGCEGVLLQSSRLAPLPGDVTRLAATNPVFLLWGDRSPASGEGVAL